MKKLLVKLVPDGRIWVLGGAGTDSVLQTTEIIQAFDNSIVSIRPGPKMVEPLMGHCAAVLSASQVMVLGGFSTVINDYLPTARVYDFDTSGSLPHSISS
jgi:hypothetical protein